jgi:hypothetical protein
MSRSTKLKPVVAKLRTTKKAPVEGPKFQPEVYSGEVIATTDDFVFLDFPPIGQLTVSRDARPTKYAKGQRVELQIRITGNDQPSAPLV